VAALAIDPPKLLSASRCFRRSRSLLGATRIISRPASVASAWLRSGRLLITVLP